MKTTLSKCALLAVVTLLFLTPVSRSLAQTFSLDLDTYDGSSSRWTMDGLRAASTFRATVKATRLGQHPKWTPFLRVVVRTEKAAFGLLITAPHSKPPFQFFAQ